MKHQSVGGSNRPTELQLSEEADSFVPLQEVHIYGAQPIADVMDDFRAMLAQASYDLIVENIEMEHVPLKQLMKKKAKEKEIVDTLRCHRSEISKFGIQL